MADFTNPSPTVSHGISTAMEMLFHDDLNRSHSRRLQAYRKYWMYYLGKHWSYVRDPGEPTITVNYCKRIVNVHVDFTFKKGFKVVIPDDPTTPGNESDDREFVRKELEETWRKNKKRLWAMEAGQQGSVTGDVFVRVSWDKTDPLEEPYARADIIPSHLCFPEFGGPSGIDRKRLTRIIIVTPTFRQKRDATIVGSFFSTRKNSPASELVIQSEEWTAPIYNKDGTLRVEAMVQYYEDGEPLGPPKVNPLGDIPVVHIPNYPLSGEFYGISDLTDAMELNREYNEKMTDISDIVNYHASPVTCIFGAKLKDLEKGANRVWGLPRDAKVENLMLDGDLGAAVAHKESIRKAMMELTATPEHAIGTGMAVSNTTGVALQMLYMPMMEMRDVKVLTYGLGIRLINRLMLKVMAIGDVAFGKKLNALGGNKYRNDVKFPDPMPHDEVHELEKSQMRLDLRLTTRELELEKMGKSQGEITKIIEESLKEEQEAVDAMFGASPRTGGADRRGKGQAIRGGSNLTRGAKIGNTLTKKEK